MSEDENHISTNPFLIKPNFLDQRYSSEAEHKLKFA